MSVAQKAMMPVRKQNKDACKEMEKAESSCYHVNAFSFWALEEVSLASHSGSCQCLMVVLISSYC